MNTEYVPYQLSDHVFKNFKDGKIIKKSTSDIISIINNINPMLASFYLPESELIYTNDLYPHQVAKLLALSNTDKWPGYDVNELVEFILAKWLKEYVDDPSEYLVNLWNAIIKTNCEDGMMARLNIDIITKPFNERIIINTKNGKITQEIQSPQLTNAIKQRIKQLLQDRFISSNNILYEKISALHRHYTIEQKILSWIGYIAVKTIIISSPAPITFNGRLLIQSK